MKINIVTGPFLSVPPAPTGAVEWVWYLIGKELARRGHSVTILARGAEVYADDTKTPNLRIIRSGGARQTNRLSLDLISDFLYSARQAMRLPRADATITNTFWLPPLLRVVRRSGQIVVSVNRFPKRQMFLYRHCQVLAACSTSIAEAIIQQSPSLEAIVRIIPNVIDSETFVPPAKVRDYSGLKRILFFGRLHPEKGLDLLIKAFRQASERRDDLRLTIMGPWETSRGGGGEGYFQELRALAQGLAVEFRDPVSSRTALRDVCYESHFFCYPSKAAKGEALPVAPLEAMATGLVPIVSSLECFRDYVNERTGVVFDHLDHGEENLATAVGSLCADEVRVREMSKAAAEKAATFSPQAVATTLIGFLQGEEDKKAS